jgi:phage shock protein C
MGHGTFLSGLYRDPERGWLQGVCAGLADYFGIDVALVRVGTIIAGFLFNWFTVAAYVALAIYLPRKPADQRAEPDEDGFWRKLRVKPSGALSDLLRRHQILEKRLADLEAEVTSAEFRLREQFRNMR